MKFLGVLMLAVASLSAQHADPDLEAGEAAASAYIGNPEAIEAGGELYRLVCSGCHGVTGEGGRGPNLVTARNVHRLGDQRLFDVIKKGIPGSDMPPSPFEDEKVWQITAHVRNLSAPALRQNVAGDPEAGKTLFYGKAGCTNCHMIRGSGGFIGPDFTNLGATQNYAQIREGLLDVNKRFTQGFDPVVVTLADGERIEGIAKNYSNYRLQLLDRNGRLHLLDRAKVELEFKEDSFMPADYVDRLSEDEIQNLLAFLSRQSLRAAGSEDDSE